MEQPIDDRIAYIMVRYRETGPVTEGGTNPFYMDLPREKKETVVHQLARAVSVIGEQLLGDEASVKAITDTIKNFASHRGAPAPDVPPARPIDG